MNQVINYWFNLGIKAFEDEGYEPNEIVSCFPSDIELDGRSSSVRSNMMYYVYYHIEIILFDKFLII
jgi:hypothetical protein